MGAVAAAKSGVQAAVHSICVSISLPAWPGEHTFKTRAWRTLSRWPSVSTCLIHCHSHYLWGRHYSAFGKLFTVGHGHGDSLILKSYKFTEIKSNGKNECYSVLGDASRVRTMLSYSRPVSQTDLASEFLYCCVLTTECRLESSV